MGVVQSATLSCAQRKAVFGECAERKTDAEQKHDAAPPAYPSLLTSKAAFQEKGDNIVAGKGDKTAAGKGDKNVASKSNKTVAGQDNKTVAGKADNTVASHSGPASEMKSKVDLSGRWLLTHFEGDMFRFLTELGLSEKECQEARESNYGIGQRQLKFNQVGNDISIDMKISTRHSTSLKFAVGQDSQFIRGFHREPCKVDAAWIDRGYTLRLQTTPVQKDDRKKASLTVTREYYKDGGYLVCAIPTPGGKKVKQFFIRMDHIPDFSSARKSSLAAAALASARTESRHR